MPAVNIARDPTDLSFARVAVLGGVALLLAGCAPGPDDGGSGETMAGETTAGEACAADATDDLGAEPFFAGWKGELVFRGFTGYSSLAGAFLDGPVVGLHVESQTSGQCRLMTYAPTLCEPSCTGDQLCQNAICVDQPHRLSGGMLTLSGPITPALVAAPDGIDGYFVESTAALDRAAPLRLEGTAGADVPAFVATTCPVDEAAAEGDWAALLAARKPGADVTLRWQNPDPQARIRLTMTTGVATHGGIAHAEIECEGPDTGALTLPGSFLDTLYAEGWSCGECGNNELIRYRSALIGATGTAFTNEAVTTFFFIP